MRNSLNTFIDWFLYTARFVGCPLLAFGLLFAGRYTLFTTTCMVANYQCKEAIGWEELMGRYAARLISSGKAELKDTSKKVSDDDLAKLQ